MLIPKRAGSAIFLMDWFPYVTFNIEFFITLKPGQLIC
jgi:hypothetical protein